MTTETETAVENSPVAPKSDAAGAAKPTYEQLEEYHERAIADNAKYRNSIRDYKSRLSELEPQASKAAELEDRIPQIEAKAREKVTKAEFWALLRSDGVTDRDVLLMLDKHFAEVKYDDNGDPVNVGEIYDSFKTSKQFLFEPFAKKNHSNTSTTKLPEAPHVEGPNIEAMSDEDFAEYRRQLRQGNR